MKYLYLIAGGSIGTTLRYLTSSWMLESFSGSKFPWGTFVVNLTGSLIIGFLAGVNQSSEFSLNLRLFLFAGILGGFTTYSGYALETFQLLKSNHFTLAGIYVISTTLLGLVLAAAGYWLSTLSSWK